MNRVELAKSHFMNGYNCAQAVVLAYCDLLDVDAETALRFAEAFGGGMGRMRLVCGAVSGMFMLASLKYSSGTNADMVERKKLYEKVQELSAAFQEKNKTITCAELLGESLPRESSATPTARTSEFYKKRPCVDLVGDCAEIVEQLLFDGDVS